MIKILKRFKVLENESICQKYRHFLTRKILFIWVRKFPKRTYFTNVFWIFSKNCLKNFNFSIFKEWTHRSSEISDNFYYLVEKFIKITQKWNRSRMDEKSWKCWRKSTRICRKSQDYQYLTMNFHQAVKIKNPSYNNLRVWSNEEENVENCKANFETFLNKISWKNWLFHNFF